MGKFTKATKKKAKARIALAGPSGSGKTFTALTIAQGLGGKVAVVDTERGSASKYADLFEYATLDMDPPYHPDRFIAAIKDAEAEGFDVVILDSITHAWSGTGGMLEEVDKFAKKVGGGNSFAAWKSATPIQNRFIDGMTGCGVHLIVTMRSKQEYILEETERNGRKTQVPRKVGMAPIQRDGVEYEFDLFAEMDLDNNMVITKSRCHALSGGVFTKPGVEVGQQIAAWLDDGAEAPPVAPKDNVTPAAENAAKIHNVGSILTAFAGLGVLAPALEKKYGPRGDWTQEQLAEMVTKGAVLKALNGADREAAVNAWLLVEPPKPATTEPDDNPREPGSDGEF